MSGGQKQSDREEDHFLDEEEPVLSKTASSSKMFEKKSSKLSGLPFQEFYDKPDDEEDDEEEEVEHEVQASDDDDDNDGEEDEEEEDEEEVTVWNIADTVYKEFPNEFLGKVSESLAMHKKTITTGTFKGYICFYPGNIFDDSECEQDEKWQDKTQLQHVYWFSKNQKWAEKNGYEFKPTHEQTVALVRCASKPKQWKQLRKNDFSRIFPYVKGRASLKNAPPKYVYAIDASDAKISSGEPTVAAPWADLRLIHKLTNNDGKTASKPRSVRAERQNDAEEGWKCDDSDYSKQQRREKARVERYRIDKCASGDDSDDEDFQPGSNMDDDDSEAENISDIIPPQTMNVEPRYVGLSCFLRYDKEKFPNTDYKGSAFSADEEEEEEEEPPPKPPTPKKATPTKTKPKMPAVTESPPKKKNTASNKRKEAPTKPAKPAKKAKSVSQPKPKPKSKPRAKKSVTQNGAAAAADPFTEFIERMKSLHKEKMEEWKKEHPEEEYTVRNVLQEMQSNEKLHLLFESQAFKKPINLLYSICYYAPEGSALCIKEKTRDVVQEEEEELNNYLDF